MAKQANLHPSLPCSNRLNQILLIDGAIQIFQKVGPNMMLHLIMEKWEEMIDQIEQKGQGSLLCMES